MSHASPVCPALQGCKVCDNKLILLKAAAGILTQQEPGLWTLTLLFHVCAMSFLTQLAITLISNRIPAIKFPGTETLFLLMAFRKAKGSTSQLHRQELANATAMMVGKEKH